MLASLGRLTGCADVRAGPGEHMPRPDGGVVAARGFQYQYLRTVDEMLRLVEQGREDVLSAHIEGRPSVGEDEGQAVDLELQGVDGSRLKVIQVKSVADPATSRPMDVTGALRILLAMIRIDACSYELITNGRGGDGARRLARVLEEQGDVATAMTASDPASPAVPLIASQSRESLSRLRRCRIRFETDGPEAMKVDLHMRLRQFRSNRRAGVGVLASGLLLKVLVQDVFQRAASQSGREFTLQAFRERLMTDSLAVATLAGRFTWGRPIGLVPVLPPDVARVELREELRRALTTGPTPGVRSCAVLGLSGIGKSSLVADYAAEFADDYDFVLWVSADDEQSIRASFAAFADVIGAQPGLATGTPTDLRDRVHRILAEHPGDWLLVFDNAANLHEVEPWYPRAGSGHLIVTSTNSGFWRLDHRLDVEGMTADEARQLLQHRFNVTPALATNEEEDAVALLSAELAGWPLALELAAGYLVDGQLRLIEARDYLQLIKTQALRDESARPAGYPRTLAAAIEIAIIRMQDHSRQRIALPADVAVRALELMTYLNGRAIPAELLCAVALGRAPAEGRPLVESVVARGEVHDLIRMLTSESLVKRQHLVLRGLDQQPERRLEVLAVNEIVQEVVRGNAEQAEMSLRGLAAHFGMALRQHLSRQDLTGLDLTELQVTSLLQHAIRLGVLDPELLLLFGNLATVRHLRGSPTEGLQLIEMERAMLLQLEDESYAILANIEVQRAQFLSVVQGDPYVVVEAVRGAMANLRLMSSEDARDFNDGWPFCAQLSQILFILQQLNGVPVPPSMFADLEDLAERFPTPSGGSQEVLGMARFDQLVDDDPGIAVSELTERLADPLLPFMDRLHLTMLSCDAHARIGQEETAIDLLRAAAADLGNAPYLRGAIVQRGINAAFPLLHGALREDRLNAGATPGCLRDALEVIRANVRATEASEYDRLRLDVLEAGLALCYGDVAGARGLTRTVRATYDRTADQLANNLVVRDPTSLDLLISHLERRIAEREIADGAPVWDVFSHRRIALGQTCLFLLVVPPDAVRRLGALRVIAGSASGSCEVRRIVTTLALSTIRDSVGIVFAQAADRIHAVLSLGPREDVAPKLSHLAQLSKLGIQVRWGLCASPDLEERVRADFFSGLDRRRDGYLEVQVGGLEHLG
jgi:hypothetical protein